MTRKLTRFEWLKERVSYCGDDCLLWPFGRDDQGYGMVAIGGGVASRAHRVMCELVHGPAPKSSPQACHSCGNGRGGCVNPRHLSWKDNSENQKDRRRHGTHIGAIGSRTRLTMHQIADIRRRREIDTQESLAKQYGVSGSCIQYWQGHDRQPALPGTSRSSIERQRRRLINID